jgi:nucleoside-diphosphate-sugar epimerase
MKVAVVGAGGFVGRALAARLLFDGHDVLPLVRTPRGLPGETLTGEIDGNTDWSGVLGGAEAVVHLAARVHVMDENDADPLKAYRRVNVEGTLNLARQAAAQGVRRFVFLSSIKVNGERTAPGRPFRADDVPAPEDAYGISKLEAEQGLRALAAESGMAVTIIRPPLVHGPGAGGNFAAMVRWLKRGRPLPLGSASANQRSLVGIDNLVDFIALCLLHPEAANRTLLVSDGEDVSTKALLERLGAALGKKARLLPAPKALLRGTARLLGKGAAVDRLFGSLQVDISESRHLLGWTPPVSLDEGLRRAVQDP